MGWEHPLLTLNAMGLCWGDGSNLTWQRDVPTEQALHETTSRHHEVPVALEKCSQSVPVQLIFMVCLDLSPASWSQDPAKRLN